MKGAKQVSRLAVEILHFAHSLRGEESESSIPDRVIVMAMFVALYSLVMDDETWASRGDLFQAFGQSKWPEGVDARERINAILDGINLRSDFWSFN